MTPSDREAAGQRIARARRRRALSQAVLAGLIGRSESWLSQVERGKRGVDSHSVLVRLAEVLRVDIEEFTGSGDQAARLPCCVADRAGHDGLRHFGPGGRWRRAGAG
jgi:transcriptional regulator with XRE-family HTH domain